MSRKTYLTDMDARVESSRKALLEHPGISDSNKELIEKFILEYSLEKNLQPPTVVKYLSNLRLLTLELDCELSSLLKNKDKILKLIDHLKRKDIGTEEKPRKYGECSIYDFKKTLKVFFKWLYGKDGQYPPCVSWLKVSRPPHKKKIPEEILARKDILKMVRAARTTRDKAIIYALWESGCRRTEFFTRRIKHLEFDDYGAILVVDGKTGMRRIRLVESISFLSNWLNSHPDRDNPNAPLWVCIDKNRQGRQIRPQTIVDVLKLNGKRAEVRKRIHPHAFRNSRATYLAGRITEQQLKVLMGWTPDSEMCAKYVHLSGRDIDNALLEMNGLKMKDNHADDQQPTRCSLCDFINSPLAKFCGRCARPLSTEIALELDNANSKIDRIMDAIMADPQKSEVFRTWMQEIAQNRV